MQRRFPSIITPSLVIIMGVKARKKEIQKATNNKNNQSGSKNITYKGNRLEMYAQQ
jgi:hypothetical protein